MGKKIMNGGKGRGVQSQIYVRIGLEEQSQGKRNQGRQESKAGRNSKQNVW